MAGVGEGSKPDTRFIFPAGCLSDLPAFLCLGWRTATKALAKRPVATPTSLPPTLAFLPSRTVMLSCGPREPQVTWPCQILLRAAV